MSINALTEKIIGCAYRVHNALGAGFLEKVYENALLMALNAEGIETYQQAPVNVYYKNQTVGEFFADLLIPNQLIIELKAVRELAKEHEVQVVNYLNATKIENGLLINFGPSVTVKRKFRTYQQENFRQDLQD
jgi:GxxExxY protein